MTTIDVQGFYLVHAGQDLAFAGESAFDFVARPSGKPSELVIKGSVAADFSASTVEVDATVYGAVDQGPARLEITADGTLSVTGEATGVHGFVAAFSLGADGSRVINHGLIDAQGQSSIVGGEIHGADARMLNAGRVEVSADTAFGLLTGGTSPTLVNTGLIEVTAGATGRGVMLLSHSQFHNSGQVLVQATTEAVAVYIPGDGSEIRNFGTLQAIATDPRAGSLGIAYAPASGTFALVNSGLISATTAIRVPFFADTVLHIVNSGRIEGLVSLGGGDDVLHNAGVMVGDVDLGAGGDRYDGSDGEVQGGVFGAAGADRLFGGAAGDLLYGDGLTANAADGADFLHGGHGEDSLHGGGGADTLWGGAGADQLHGDGGADVFVFAKASDSVPGHADLIADLEAADTIDLGRIDADTTQAGDQAFQRVAAFDGHAGELVARYDAAAGLTTFSGDVDGDGRADLVITAAGDQSGFAGFVL